MSAPTLQTGLAAIPPGELHQRLAALRTELTELAFALERDGDRVAADVATYAAGRVGELCFVNEYPREMPITMPT